MAMRAPKNEATGTSGESFVAAYFEQLGWGVMPNFKHDLGTDMVVQVRDDAGYDLGMLIGVQAKSGPTWFEEPCIEGRETVGWWFREDADHFDYWLAYQAAHLVVLHHQDSGIAYRVHVTQDRVLSTGKGRKILVPSDQTVDATHLRQLALVAESKARVPQWDGSAWALTALMPEEARLRYALVTPRLVAPHANAKVDDLQPEGAIALAVQMRLSDLQRLHGPFPILAPDEARASDVWGWRFYAAVRDMLSKGDSEVFKPVIETAPSAAEKAAVSVCYANALLEDGAAAEARSVLDASLEADGLGVADRLWLTAQKARAANELGDVAEARELASNVKQIDGTLLNDPTLRVLLGSASQMIFNLGDWSPSSTADVVQGRDNMANLWRSQVVADGLGIQADRAFRRWVPDSAVMIGAADVPWMKFRSAMLLAGHAADAPSWRYASTLLVHHQVTGDVAEVPRWVFDLLRLAGADKDLRLISGRLVKLGPESALIEASSELDLSQSLRTSLQASITLVETSADLLPSDVCDRHARWGLAVLTGEDDVEARLQPQFYVGAAVLKMVRALWRGTSEGVQSAIRQHFVQLPPIENPFSASAYARLLDHIDDDSWSDEQMALLDARPAEENFELAEAIERLRAARSDDVRQGLISRIATGDLQALGSYGSVTDLAPDVASGAIASLVTKVDQQTQSARDGAYPMGGHDLLRALALLNIWHPSEALWGPFFEALREPKVLGEHLEGALDLVGTMTARIPEDVRADFREPLEIVRGRTSFPSAFGETSPGESARGLATLALAVLFPDAIGPADLSKLVRGDAGERGAAARILAERGDSLSLVALAALSRDEDPEVRALVAEGVARWVVRGIGGEASVELVRELLCESGVDLGIAVAGALGEGGASAGIRLVADLLIEHRSTLVRTHTARVLANLQQA